MEKFIANLVKSFESGQVSRREFCETMALAATVYAVGGPAQAQTTNALPPRWPMLNLARARKSRWNARRSGPSGNA